MQEPETEDRPTNLSQKLSELSAEKQAQLLGRITKQQDVNVSRGARRSRHVNENLPFVGDNKKMDTMRRHARKRRSNEKMGATVVGLIFICQLVVIFFTFFIFKEGGLLLVLQE